MQFFERMYIVLLERKVGSPHIKKKKKKKKINYLRNVGSITSSLNTCNMNTVDIVFQVTGYTYL